MTTRLRFDRFELGVDERRLTIDGEQAPVVDEAFIAPLTARSRAALGDATFETAESDGAALAANHVTRELQTWLEQTAPVL